MKKFSVTQSFVLFPNIIYRIIKEGRPWSILTSFAMVVVASAVFGICISLRGFRFAGVVLMGDAYGGSLIMALWQSLIILPSIWMALTIVVAEMRSGLIHRPIDIDTEGHCLAIPFVLILPISLIMIAPIEPATARYLVFFLNLLPLALILNLIGTVGILNDETKASRPLRNTSSRVLASWIKIRLYKDRNASNLSLAALAFCIFGGAFWSLSIKSSLLDNAPPLSLSVIIGAIVLWIIISRFLGDYRSKRLDDPQGLRAAIMTLGRPVAILLLMTPVLSVGRDTFISGLPSPLVDWLILALITLIIPIALLYFLIAANGLLILSKRYSPIIARNQDLYGEIALPEYIYPEVSSSGLKGILSRLEGTRLLWLVLPAHGLAVSILKKSPLAPFMSINSFEFDFLAGIGSAFVFILFVVLILYGIHKIFKTTACMQDIFTLVGKSLLPLSVLILLAILIPGSLKTETAKIFFPAVLLWSLGFILLGMVQLTETRPAMRNVSVITLAGVLIVYVLTGGLIQSTHRFIVCHMRIPLVQVRDTIRDEFPRSMQSDVRYALSGIRNVDLAEITVGDFVDQIRYTKKVENRFYGIGGFPNVGSLVRIRHEPTANAGWMRIMYPEMRLVTRDAKNPKEATEAVYRWLGERMQEIYPITYPLGDKFDQDPITTMICRHGNQLDAAILMVAALRASGVAARITYVYPDQFINGTYTLAEYYDGYEWKPCCPEMRYPKRCEVNPSELERLALWVSKIPSNSRLTFHVLQGGVWRPYCSGGKNNPAKYSLNLEPGTYLASYVTGDVCHVTRFVLHEK